MNFGSRYFQQDPNPETGTDNILSDIDKNNLTTQEWSAQSVDMSSSTDSDRDEDAVRRGPITRIGVKRFSTIALWSWKETVEICAICRSALLETCITCEGGGMTNPYLCQSVKGSCNHEFHFHCIQRWLVENRPHCPLCNYAWPPYSDSNDSNNSLDEFMLEAGGPEEGWGESGEGGDAPLPFE